MKRSGALAIIFAFFLGLVLVAFVWIGVMTFYPEPAWNGDGGSAAQDTWRLTTGIILLITATIVLAVSLALPTQVEAISNGLLLGGVFTMVSAVAMALSAQNGGWRFGVVTAALVVTIAIGYLRFGRHGGGSAKAAPAAESTELTQRLEVVERRIEAIRRAVQD